MTFEQKERTVPIPSAPTDGEQPVSKSSISSITEELGKGNPSEEDYEEIVQRTQRLYDPAYLPTVSMTELYENIYLSGSPVIEGFLHTGTYLFVGAPKIGKSFFMLQLAYHVSTGFPMWGYPIHKGTVLYLALEDDYHRLQGRLFRMFGTNSSDNLHFAVCAKQLHDGLVDQLQLFVKDHPDTRLIIIDTLQKVRNAGSEKFSYANDHEVITRLKEIAARCGICLLLVHHTRKQQAEDKFDMISGTNGLLGAADGAFLLQKESRTDNTATLDISGRDQQDQRLYLRRDVQRLTWNLERKETEPWKEPLDPVLEAVAALITVTKPQWCGTATELVSILHLDMKANALAMQLNVRAGRLLSEYHIRYENFRTHAGRNIKLTLETSKV